MSDLMVTRLRSRAARWIKLAAAETKEKRADERPVPPHLNGASAWYLTWARPTLSNEGEFVIGSSQLLGHLWISDRGQGLSYGGVERVIVDTTLARLGIPISPHDLRRSAATTAVYLGDNVNLASAVLHHRDRRITDKHYNRASSIGAARDYLAFIRSVRANEPRLGRSAARAPNNGSSHAPIDDGV